MIRKEEPDRMKYEKQECVHTQIIPAAVEMQYR